MALKSGSRNLNGIFDTCKRFGWLLLFFCSELMIGVFNWSTAVLVAVDTHDTVEVIACVVPNCVDGAICVVLEDTDDVTLKLSVFVAAVDDGGPDSESLVEVCWSISDYG